MSLDDGIQGKGDGLDTFLSDLANLGPPGKGCMRGGLSGGGGERGEGEISLLLYGIVLLGNEATTSSIAVGRARERVHGKLVVSPPPFSIPKSCQ